MGSSHNRVRLLKGKGRTYFSSAMLGEILSKLSGSDPVRGAREARRASQPQTSLSQLPCRWSKSQEFQGTLGIRLFCGLVGQQAGETKQSRAL
jgi:hypothetical protein